jgi:hypothetical protein
MDQADSVHSTPPINTSATDQDIHAPESPQDALYLPTNVTPEEKFQAIGRLRKEARDEIDRLIRFLDKTDDHVSRELEDSIDDNPHDEETDDNGEDNEDADPAELSEASGIGDLDGLRERYSGARFSSGLRIDGVVCCQNLN